MNSKLLIVDISLFLFFNIQKLMINNNVAYIFTIVTKWIENVTRTKVFTNYIWTGCVICQEDSLSLDW